MAIVILVLSQKSKDKQISKKLAPLFLPSGKMVSMELFGNNYPYYLRHDLSTSDGLSTSTDKNFLRVSGWIETTNFLSLNPGAHFSLNLRNKISVRDFDKVDPNIPGAVTLGHGVIFGNVSDDHQLKHHLREHRQ